MKLFDVLTFTWFGVCVAGLVYYVYIGGILLTIIWLLNVLVSAFSLSFTLIRLKDESQDNQERKEDGVMPCEHNHEGFCIAEFEDPTQRCKFAEGELKVCIATDEDLVDGYEECEFCGGPGTFPADDSPCPAPFPRKTCWRISVSNQEVRKP